MIDDFHLRFTLNTICQLHVTRCILMIHLRLRLSFFLLFHTFS